MEKDQWRFYWYVWILKEERTKGNAERISISRIPNSLHDKSFALFPNFQTEKEERKLSEYPSYFQEREKKKQISRSLHGVHHLETRARNNNGEHKYTRPPFSYVRF